MRTEIKTMSSSLIYKHYFKTEQIRAPAVLFHVHITEGLFFWPIINHQISQRRKEDENEAKLNEEEEIITSNFCSLVMAMTAWISRKKEISEPRLSQYQPQPRGKTIKMKGWRLADDICTYAKQSQRKWQLLWKITSFKTIAEEKQGVKLGVCDLFSRCLLKIPVKGRFPNNMFYIIFYLKHVHLLL